MTPAMAKPPSVSISGAVWALIAPILLPRLRTVSIDWFMRVRIADSRLNALTMRMPWAVSCIDAMICVMPANSIFAMLRIWRIRWLTPRIAIGPITSTISDIQGLWMIITRTSPTTDRRSRTKLVRMVLSSCPAAWARTDIAAMRSLEWVRSK